MPRKKPPTYDELVRRERELCAELEGVRSALVVLNWARTRTAGETVQFSTKKGGPVKTGLIGAFQDRENKDRLYFVYVDRASGFGADGFEVPSTALVYPEGAPNDPPEL